MLSSKLQLTLRDRKVLAAIFTLILLTSLFSVFVGYQLGTKAQSSALTMQTNSGGPYPGAPTYTIFAESGTYYAKDAYGAITSSTNASYVIGQVMTAILALGDEGGQITVVGTPIPFAATLGYVANNTCLYGIGEVQITSTSSGADEFIMREGATLTNIFIKQQGNSFVDKYETWSPYFARLQHWSDFPSLGGELYTIPGQTSSAYMIMDGTITTEGVGEIIASNVRFWPQGANTYGIFADAYGEICGYNIGTGNLLNVHGVTYVTGAVNSVTVTFPHGYVLDATPTYVNVVAQQSGQGKVWVAAYTVNNITIAFDTQPDASYWWFFYEAMV